MRLLALAITISVTACQCGPGGALIGVEYESSNGSKQAFQQVQNATSCTGASFYVQGNEVVLCPEACATVKADAQAKVRVRFTCEPTGFTEG